MRYINHKTVYIKNPDTNEYEGLPALRGEQGLPGTDVASIHVGEDEPTNENCVAWITPDGSSSINLPEINDGEINAVDTWSSEKINNEFNNQTAILTTEIQQRDRVVNLLDNSDFRAAHFIAQAGLNGLHGTTKYVGDRWISWSADATFADGYITPGSPIDQRIALNMVDLNKTYTVAFCLADGTIKVASALLTTGVGSYAFGMHAIAESSHVRIRLMTNFSIRWAALYEGAYTADTLPEYQPKGYAMELAECQRYYYQSWTDSIGPAGIITRQSMSPTRLASVEMPVAMRVNPTITICNSNGIAGAIKDWDDSTVISGITTVYASNKNFVPASVEGKLTAGQWYSFHYSASADL